VGQFEFWAVGQFEFDGASVRLASTLQPLPLDPSIECKAAHDDQENGEYAGGDPTQDETRCTHE
jgi:hypothetical protein